MSTEWSRNEAALRNRTTRRDIALGIEHLAADQKQLVRLEQLKALGLTARAVQLRVDSRTLFRVHDGVFSLHPPPYSHHQQYLAAVYACGRGTFISDQAAAWLLGALEAPPSLPILTNRSGAGRKNHAFVIHRRSVARQDIFKWSGIACTKPERTVLDCADGSSVEQLEELLMALDSKKPYLRRWRLEQLIVENAGARGIRNLRFLTTDDLKETDSENERRMLRICRRYGIPDFETQYPVSAGGRNYRADFCWPELRLIVECDSWRWHGGKLKTEDDRERDQLLTIAGWIVLHFTRNQIALAPEVVGPRLVALVERLG